MFEGLTWLAVRTAAKSFLGRNWEVLLILAAIGAGLWYVDHRGYERAEAQNHARDLERQQIANDVVRQLDANLKGQLDAIAASSSGKIQTIDTEGKTVVQPIITRELIRDPGLADPGRCLSPGLLAAVNAARGYFDQRLAGGDDNAGSASPRTVPGPGQSH